MSAVTGWPTSSVSAWRVAARLARREVRRRPGRTALVVALVALPVAGMLTAIVYLRTDELSDSELWRFGSGRADAVVHEDTAVTPGPLPEGSRTVEYVATRRVVATAAGDLCSCSLTDMPFDPLTDGIVQVTSGRAPAAPGEVLLSREAAQALGSGLGEQVELVQPFGLDATVVGTGYQSSWIDEPIIVVAHGTPGLVGAGFSTSQQLVDLPDDLTPAEIEAWEAAAGAHLVSPDLPVVRSTVTSGDDATAGVRWTWVGGAVGLTVLGIVIAAAFAAGARRQLATLGQLAANGATPAQLRRVLFLQGTVTGLIGSAAGLGLGALGLVALRSSAPRLMNHAVLAWDIRLIDVLPVVVIATVAATVAALVPAFGASRVSVLTALAGRRPLGRVSRRRTAVGLGVAAVGLGMLGVVAIVGRNGVGGSTEQQASTVLAVLGPVLLLLGVCTATPAYLSVLRPVAAGLRGPWRLAARSLFRQRTRTSALVSAICAISAVAVAVAALGLAMEQDERQKDLIGDMPSDVVRIRADAFGIAGLEERADSVDGAVRQAVVALPDAERFAISTAVSPVLVRDFVPDDPRFGDDSWPIPEHAFVVDDPFRHAYDLHATTRRLLDRVGAVWLGPAPGRTTIDTVTAVPAAVDTAAVGQPSDGLVPSELAPRDVAPGQPITFEAAVVGPEHADGLGMPGELLVTPQRAQELGLDTSRTEVVLRTPEPLTAAELAEVDRLRLVLEAERGNGSTSTAWVWNYQPSLYVGPGIIETVPAAVALLFALFVVAVGLALAAAETRDERDVLAALGAAPRTVRRANGCKAFLLTLLGGAVAVPVGLLPVAVSSRLAEDDTLSLVVPWRTIALLVVAVPLLAAAVTAAATAAAALTSSQIAFREPHIAD